MGPRHRRGHLLYPGQRPARALQTALASTDSDTIMVGVMLLYNTGVRVQMDRSVADLMLEDAKFWVVEPRLTLSGVSGLGTLLSGNFIDFEVDRPRNSAGHHRRPARPAVRTAGRQPRFAGIGSPIYYRRLQAGQVIAYDLSSDGKAKLTMRRAYGFRTFRAFELALYHTLGGLPEPEGTHRFN